MKTALVTGASRGIGKATALLLAKHEYQIVINYCNSETEALSLAEEINRKYPRRALPVRADISSPTEIANLMVQAREFFGSIDILVNNAGVSVSGLVTDTTEAEWDRLFNVNVKGMFLVAKAVLPYMISRQSGKIINVSSIWGITGASYEVAYSTTKAAVIGFTKALAREVGPSGIQVNCVAPGVIDTDMNTNLDKQSLDDLKEQTPLGAIGTPEDVAQTILFLAGENSNFITGQVISPNGGFCI